MKKQDYKCPHCRRLRRFESKKPVVEDYCGCQGGNVEFILIPWENADWRLYNTPLAAAMGLTVSVVAAKRRELGKGRGKVGRKQRDRIWNKVDPSQIDLTQSNQVNAKRLGVSAERIRQLRVKLENPTI